VQLFEKENLVILGKSGSGKSVLIKCIVRLLNPDSGTINVLGENVNELNEPGPGRIEKENRVPVSERCVVRLYDHQRKSRISAQKNKKESVTKRDG
jgi:ABC-type transporter Mla maintaining outer membrane lipid asymmetry ATPase subunit MlaF